MLYAKHNPIEVYIQSVEKGTRYKEYLRNDDGTLSDDESRICYIEAVDDDQYSIAVVLQRGFRYRRAQGIRIVFKIDDVVYESNFQEKSSSSKNCVTTAQTYFKESTYTAVDDQWELATFRFGKLALGKYSGKRLDNSELTERQMRTLKLTIKILLLVGSRSVFSAAKR